MPVFWLILRGVRGTLPTREAANEMTRLLSTFWGGSSMGRRDACATATVIE
jgi:hypothetical protein